MESGAVPFPAAVAVFATPLLLPGGAAALGGCAPRPGARTAADELPDLACRLAGRRLLGTHYHGRAFAVGAHSLEPGGALD
jgi:hypothetical protein